tara:strand:- start:1797 stop:1979 length:183 start_codon:yes stop_codon:yes gene_type:complete
LNEELDMYGDPKKDCCVKNCTTKADLKEKNRFYCCNHYAKIFLKMSLNDIKINKESSKGD